MQSHDDVKKWVLEKHTSNSHWCCSAKMGNDRATSAVDGNLKVHGIENLYVADASVFPNIPNGNVHSTVLAVASAFAKRLASKRG